MKKQSAYQKLKAKNQQQKDDYIKLRQELIEVCMSPGSVKSLLIRRSVRMEVGIEEAIWYVDMNELK